MSPFLSSLFIPLLSSFVFAMGYHAASVAAAAAGDVSGVLASARTLLLRFFFSFAVAHFSYSAKVIVPRRPVPFSASCGAALTQDLQPAAFISRSFFWQSTPSNALS